MRFSADGHHLLGITTPLRSGKSRMVNDLRDLEEGEGCGSRMFCGGCWNFVGNLNHTTVQVSKP